MGFLPPGTVSGSSNGQFNVGPDRTLVITDEAGNQYDFGPDLIRFKADPMHEMRERRTISSGGRRKTRTLPQGWHGEFTYGRVNGDMEKFQIAKDTAIYETGNEPLFTIATYTRNATDGSVDEFSFVQCTLNMTSGPEFSLQGDPECAFTFDAYDCVDENGQSVN